MFLSLLSNMLRTLQEIFEPQVSASNTLNPTLLSIGQRGYEIQSKYLMISDQYGLFTSGPPRLQVYQGFVFFFLPCMLVASFIPLVFMGVVMPGETCSGKFWVLVLVQALL
ncbi:hypothetical protein DL95DRAFT_396570, partial [Leptodontidium sp. 2 PMI_412]